MLTWLDWSYILVVYNDFILSQSLIYFADVVDGMDIL